MLNFNTVQQTNSSEPAQRNAFVVYWTVCLCIESVTPYSDDWHSLKGDSLMLTSPDS